MAIQQDIEHENENEEEVDNADEKTPGMLQEFDGEEESDSSQVHQDSLYRYNKNNDNTQKQPVVVDAINKRGASNNPFSRQGQPQQQLDMNIVSNSASTFKD